MDEKKVAKIQEVILENPEIHTQLIGALRALLNKVGEVFTAEELFSALKTQVGEAKGHSGSTYDEFWAHYR